MKRLLFAHSGPRAASAVRFFRQNECFE